jgi:hypothetical protein
MRTAIPYVTEEAETWCGLGAPFGSSAFPPDAVAVIIVHRGPR